MSFTNVNTPAEKSFFLWQSTNSLYLLTRQVDGRSNGKTINVIKSWIDVPWIPSTKSRYSQLHSQSLIIYWMWFSVYRYRIMCKLLIKFVSHRLKSAVSSHSEGSGFCHLHQMEFDVLLLLLQLLLSLWYQRSLYRLYSTSSLRITANKKQNISPVLYIRRTQDKKKNKINVIIHLLRMRRPFIMILT